MEKEINKSSAYLSGLGCFIFFISLVIGFIYISVHIYKTYAQQSAETEEMEENEDLDDTIEEDRRAVKKNLNLDLVIKNIHKMNSEEIIYQFMDKIESLSSFSKKEKKLLLEEAQIRLQNLKNKNKK